MVGQDISVRFALPAGVSRSFGSQIDDALRRSTVFEPLAGRVLTWSALPLLLLVMYFATRVAATAQLRSQRYLVVAACGVALAHGATWAVLLHPFHGADESEHFAYAQHLAATNDRPDDSADSQRPPYSSAEERLMAALHHNSTTLNPSSRPRWDEFWETRWREALRGTSPSDGGGFTESGTGHGPLYYGLIGLPLRVFDAPAQQPSVLLMMRLLNAVLAALVAGIAVIVAGLLFPRRSELQWLAGVLAGMQPVFGSVAGSVNNDTAVNVAAAVMVLLLVTSVVRGPSTRLAACVGALMVVLPLAKITGFGVVPVVGVAAFVLAIRYGAGAAARWAITALGLAACCAVAWIFVISPLMGTGSGSLVYRHPAVASAPNGSPTPGPPGPTPIQKAEYVAQTFIPGLSVGGRRFALPGASALERWPAYRIYVDRGYGLFGWKSTNLTIGLLRGIFAGLLVGWMLAIAAAIRHRSRWREWAGPVTVLLGAIGSVLLFVSWAYASLDVRTDLGEQGRYIFPALVPLSVLLVSGGMLVKKAAYRQAFAGLGTVAASGLAVLTWTSALRGWFT
ncbi:DUF2142 domain-containing protein [Paraconexibacter algicola]|uniref:DUF2142 domain-containing protein n=1 Tax=Paraconexibacter algicola TaxID=2133960 RepID=UPI0011B26A36|nr:DUF2142 domain-containing protein [Paraconexibacter algicola]